MMNLDVDDAFWSSDSESIARYIHDQVGLIEDYDCEMDWSLIESIFATPVAVTPKLKWLKKLLDMIEMTFD
ncbi:hypothetical protein ACL6C3_22425 [Capilliphycus salinus ALCB114379]|uniref:hypothetical protein n=1 Tax=Capilliphycus salinus TaxID=2768948 RepID=UPI0039A6F930